MVLPLNAVDVHRVPKTRVGGEHKRGVSPHFVRGVGEYPHENFVFKTTKEAIMLLFETIFPDETPLILQIL